MKRAKPRRTLLKILTCFISFIVVVFVGLLGAVAIINLGPSETVRDLFVVSMMQTSAAKVLARAFFTEEEIEKIIEGNGVVGTDAITDPSLVDSDGAGLDMEKITVEDVSGATYRGKMMIINDPARVSVATIPDYSSGVGMTVSEMMELENAVAGVNGGAFEDIGGMGRGSVPLGIVVSHGVLRNGVPSEVSSVIGLDGENRLVVGKMTVQQALDMGVRDAVAFGPALIVNGEAAEVTGGGGGLNPRTAIGQRADGAILLLVIDGRQPNSLGGSYKDIIDVMLEYGAVNAANLDGGNSSHMVYNGEIITSCASMNGPRTMPTAIVVK